MSGTCQELPTKYLALELLHISKEKEKRKKEIIIYQIKFNGENYFVDDIRCFIYKVYKFNNCMYKQLKLT